MFTLTIKSRDYIPFTVRGSHTDLMTMVMTVQAGLQARQDITVTATRGDLALGSFTIPTVHGMTDMVEALLARKA